MSAKIHISLLLVLLSLNAVTAQPLKRLKNKGAYQHKKALAVFPVSVDSFVRTELAAYDPKREHMSATYQSGSFSNKTMVTVYIYPAGGAEQYRFRIHYLGSLQMMANARLEDIDANQNYVNYTRDGYRVNGYEAYIKVNADKITALQLYECGRWFLKLRITSSVLDEEGIKQVFPRFVAAIDPVTIVDSDPISTQSEINIAPGALADSLLSGCVMSSTQAKIKWVQDNVDTLERLSGFPSLYLDMYATALDSFLSYADAHPDYEGSEKCLRYVSDIRRLKAEGFIDEFIMDELHNVMIVPEGKQFDFEAYYEWRRKHRIEYTLRSRIYDIVTFIPFSELD